MTLEACYKEIGSDFSAAVARMSGSEKMLGKFARKFPNDPTAAELFSCLEKEDYQTAFRMAHTLKGLCLNLGLDKLQRSSAELTESLRSGVSEKTPELAQQVRSDYEATVNALSNLDD